MAGESPRSTGPRSRASWALVGHVSAFSNFQTVRPTRSYIPVGNLSILREQETFGTFLAKRRGSTFSSHPPNSFRPATAKTGNLSTNREKKMIDRADYYFGKRSGKQLPRDACLISKETTQKGSTARRR